MMVPTTVLRRMTIGSFDSGTNADDNNDADSFNRGNDNGNDSGANTKVDSLLSVSNCCFRKFDVDDDGANVDADD